MIRNFNLSQAILSSISILFTIILFAVAGSSTTSLYALRGIGVLYILSILIAVAVFVIGILQLVYHKKGNGINLATGIVAIVAIVLAWFPFANLIGYIAVFVLAIISFATNKKK